MPSLAFLVDLKNLPERDALFEFRYPRNAFRDLSYGTRQRLVTHLNRRNQRKYHRPKGMSHDSYLEKLGLKRR